MFFRTFVAFVIFDVNNWYRMTEQKETGVVYQSPCILEIGFKSEGVLCFSNNIPDWEENDDIL